MINGKTVFGIIPARGGSKRVPSKNIKPYQGKPLIAWAIESAKQSKYLDYFVLSSEDDQILAIGKDCGAKCIKRPDFLATDKAMNEAVMAHLAYTYCKELPDWMVLLQPTSPHRTGEDIDTCIERAQAGSGCVTYNEHGKLNGAVYVVKTELFLSLVNFDKSLFDQFLIMPQAKSLDIDYPQDFAA